MSLTTKFIPPVRSGTIVELLEMKTRALLVGEVADLLNISSRQVYKLAAEQRIPSLRIAGCIRFDGVVLAAWLRHSSQGAR